MYRSLIVILLGLVGLLACGLPSSIQEAGTPLFGLVPNTQASEQVDEANRLIVYTALGVGQFDEHMISLQRYPALFAEHCPDITVPPAQVEVESEELTDEIEGKRYTYKSNRSGCPDLVIQIERASTGAIADRFLSERDSPRADVIWALATTQLLQAAAEGMLEPYSPIGLDRVNMRMRDTNTPPLLVGTDVFMSAFCVNTLELSNRGLPLPTSWADLLNPVYAGQIVMPDPNASGTGFIAVGALLQMSESEEQGWAFMDGLHQNIVRYTSSGSKPCRLAAAGEVPIGITYDSAPLAQQEEGAPVMAVFPTEGSGWELEANALVRKTNDKPAAKTFLDWAISDEAMRSYARLFPVTSVPTDVPLPASYPPEPIEQLMPNWRFVWLTANSTRILEEWTRRYGEKSELQRGDIPDAFK
jgi:iron(III) transport system substrate-binding protein